MKLSLLLATTVTAQFTAQISLLENSPLMTTTYIGFVNQPPFRCFQPDLKEIYSLSLKYTESIQI